MVGLNHDFNFSKISLEDVENGTRKLKTKKATTFKNIPPKCLKEDSDICCPILLQLLNDCLENRQFPDELKVADVTPVFNKDNSRNANYRLISILPVN